MTPEEFDQHDESAQAAEFASFAEEDIQNLVAEDKTNTSLTGKGEDDLLTATDPASDAELVPQSMVNDLIAEASDGEAIPEAILEPEPIPPEPTESEEQVGSENLAAAATVENAAVAPVDEVVPQETVPEETPPPKQRPKEKKERKPRPSITLTPRLLAAGIAFLLVTPLVFFGLNAYRETTPDLASLATEGTMDLSDAMTRAQSFLELGEYVQAVDTLQPPLQQAKASPLRDDAEFMLLEAMAKGMVYRPDSPFYEELHIRIDTLLERAPEHTRVPEALYWKAKLWEMDNIPFAAMDVYRELIKHHPYAPDADRILLDAATLSNTLREPTVAAEYIQQLLHRYPGSPLKAQARLVLGDAYGQAGMFEDARTIFMRTADANPHSGIGAEAYLRLGRLAMNQGDYARAVDMLKTRLETAMTTKNNDSVLLLLARAYRHQGNYTVARDELNDIINFFPYSPLIPEAMVVLSQVYEDLGERRESLNTIEYAAAQYPEDPGVQIQKGEVLGLYGRAFEAASALRDADLVGANNPEVLLMAAEYYQLADKNDMALSTYQSLRFKYADAPQALEAAVKEAELLYALGEVNEALRQLEEVAEVAAETDQELPALLTLTRIYRELGLYDRAVALATQVSGLSNEPDVVAEMAITLLSRGDLTEAQRMLRRLNLAQVENTLACEVLRTHGRALLKQDPNKGVRLLEEAYLSYPNERTQKEDQFLLESYLNTGQARSARRIVMELAARSRDNAVMVPQFIEAANTWAEYLFEQKDYRTAADAYAMVLEARSEVSPTETEMQQTVHWAQYQYANALYALRDFAGSLPLYEEISVSEMPWAQEAQLKAELAQLEQQRNLPYATGNG